MADEKLKPGGTKVRCSRCRHIFITMGPQEEAPAAPPAPPEDGVDFGAFNMQSVGEGEDQPSAASGQAAPEDAVSVATPRPWAADPPREERSSAPAEFSFDPPAADATGEASLGGEQAPYAGGEFSFQEEEPAAGAAEFSFVPAAPPDNGGEFSFHEDETTARSGEFSFDPQQPTEPSGDSSSGEDEPAARGEFTFSEEEPASGGEFTFSEEEPSAAGEFSFEDEADASEFSFDGEPADAGAGSDFSFDDPLASEDPFSASKESVPTFAVEAEKPENFDFSQMTFGEQSEVPAAKNSEPGRRLDLTPPTVERPRETTPEPFPAPDPILVPAPVRRKSPFSSVLLLVLLLLLALAGAAGYFFWQGGAPDLSTALARVTGGTPAAESGQIRLANLNGAFVENRHVGQLFVIRGMAVNDYRESRSSIAVKGVLYDKQGQPLLQQTVFTGNSLDEDALRTLPFSKIEESMNNQFGDSLSNLNVSPGKSIPFIIVFKNLPADLAEFTVEIADSKPGSG